MVAAKTRLRESKARSLRIAAKRHAPTQTAVLAPQVLEGLPFSVIEDLADRMGKSIQWIGEVIRLPPATMSRRKAGQSLTVDEGDRVWRLARVLARAEAVLGTQDRARHWIDNPIPSLDGKVPARLLVTTSGYEQVMQTLDAIDYGMGA